MKVHTQAVHFSADSKLIDFIEKKLGKLDNYFDKVLDVSVVLKLENSGQVKDKIAEVKLKLPGELLYVKGKAKSFEESVDQASASLKRQIIKYKERVVLRARRGQ